VTDLSAEQRHAFEGVLGQPLRDDQRVVIQVAYPTQEDVQADQAEEIGPAANQSRILPDWVTIFADLSDEEIAELESAILDRSEDRPQESL